MLIRHSISLLFFFFINLSFFAVSANITKKNSDHIKKVRVYYYSDTLKVVFDTSGKFSYSHFKDDKSHSVFINIKSSNKYLSESFLETFKGKKSNIISKINLKKFDGHHNKFEIVFNKKFYDRMLISSSNLYPDKQGSLQYGHRVFFEFSVKKPDYPNRIKLNTARKKSTIFPYYKKIIIAVDAGHGGFDPGSTGVAGTKEKDIVLSISKMLAKSLNNSKIFKAVLLRDKDVFVDLNDRVVRARELNADFLISIHADSFTTKKAKGASVWVLSNKRANSEIGRWMENDDERSYLISNKFQGVSYSAKQKSLSKLLLDISMDGSRIISNEMADLVCAEFKKNPLFSLHQPKPVSASLAILKSPDIPSILVETGFLSNPKEELMLKNLSYQKNIASLLYESIYKFYKNKKVENTYFNPIFYKKYIVKRGDTLSAISISEGVKLKDIVEMNNIKNNKIYINQVLKIPDYKRN